MTRLGVVSQSELVAVCMYAGVCEAHSHKGEDEVEYQAQRHGGQTGRQEPFPVERWETTCRHFRVLERTVFVSCPRHKGFDRAYRVGKPHDGHPMR